MDPDRGPESLSLAELARSLDERGLMFIGQVLRTVRESKRMSQGDIEQKTGMIRSYISRVENGHTIPSLPTLDKFARAVDVPLWQIIRGSDEDLTTEPIVKPRKGRTPAGVKTTFAVLKR